MQEGNPAETEILEIAMESLRLDRPLTEVQERLVKLYPKKLRARKLELEAAAQHEILEDAEYRELQRIDALLNCL